MTDQTCTCGAPDAFALAPNEVLVHRAEGPCTIERAIEGHEGGDDR